MASSIFYPLTITSLLILDNAAKSYFIYNLKNEGQDFDRETFAHYCM